MTVRSNCAASLLPMAIWHSSSNADEEEEEEEVQQGAKTRMRRRSASSEMFTRVDDGWGGETVMVVAMFYFDCAVEIGKENRLQ